MGEAQDTLAKEIIDEYAKTEEVKYSRRLKNWLFSYLKLTSIQEAPEIYHLWTGMSAIASSTMRKIYMDRVTHTLYPNLYIVLVATSTECKKTTAIDFMENILGEVQGLHFIKDKTTPEGLLSSMADSSVEVEDGKLKKVSHVVIMAEELGVFLSKKTQASDMPEILTKLWGCPKVFPYTTRHTPITIYNTYPNMLAGSTPEWLAKGMPAHAESGGFLGRFIFVVAKKRRQKIAHPRKFDGYDKLLEDLIHDLKIISKLKGSFRWTREAYEYYDAWYNDYDSSSDPRLKEYFDKKPHTILKIAMNLSLAESNDLSIETYHIDSALLALKNLESDMLDAFSFLGSTSESQMGRLILSILRHGGPMRKVDLMRRISYRLKKLSELDDIIKMLFAEELITREMRSSNWFYRLTSASEKREAREKKEKEASRIINMFEEDGSFKRGAI
ncbi:MAG: DUF3987 domain-containing protein [Candidatus Scalindua sp.]